MGKHRKGQRRTRHHPRRTGRRIALVSAGLLVPLTGGAVVFAATGDPERPAARPSRPRSDARTGSAIRTGSRPKTTPSASPVRRTPAPSASASPRPRIAFAPYADVLAWPPLTLPKGVKDYSMGFVSAGGGCSATWGGLSAVDAAFAVKRIKDVPGKVVVSFGGPHGVELAQDCDSVGALVKEYRKAVEAAHPAGLDFFLTETALSDTASVQRRTTALAQLERDHDLPVSITLPLHRSGLSPAGLDALRSAVAAGLDISLINLVPADGQSIIASATTAHGQLQRLYHQSDAQVWQRMGVTPIIGVAGAGAQFAPPDARQVVSWATAHGLGRLSMWSLTRDTPCTADTSVTSDTCSGLDEDGGVFTRIFEGF